MEFTYCMTVKNCEIKPKVESEFSEIPQERVNRAAEFAARNFRDVEIICEQTGEVIFRFYMASDFFVVVYNHGEALDILSQICYNPNY